jgi:hypothetical protein
MGLRLGLFSLRGTCRACAPMLLLTIHSRLYYMNNLDRLSACTLTIHALLHIADAIEAMGPVWAAWAFPTERGCGRIQRSVKGKRFLYSSIDKYVLQESQLAIVKLKYAFMMAELALKSKSKEKGQEVGNCTCTLPPSPSFMPHLHRHLVDIQFRRLLFSPQAFKEPLEASIRSLLIRTLAVRFKSTSAAMRDLLAQVDLSDYTDWAALRIMDGGDRIRSSSRAPLTQDGRNASWVQVRSTPHMLHL